MTVETPTTLDLSAFKRCYETWDVEGLLDLYDEDVELIQIDRDNPPSAPRVRSGRDTLAGMLRHCAGAGVNASVEHLVASGDRAAATVTCEFPGGRKVVANAILEVQDGRIVREHDVTIGDARS